MYNIFIAAEQGMQTGKGSLENANCLKHEMKWNVPS